MSFDIRVFDAVCKIPRGCVATYGQIAMLCGSARAARAVGNALHRNPLPGEVPCHRVVNASGALAAAFVFGGERVQRSLLEEEGIGFDGEGRVIMKKHLWRND